MYVSTHSNHALTHAHVRTAASVGNRQMNVSSCSSCCLHLSEVWKLQVYVMHHVTGTPCCIKGYSKENLKIHTGGPSPPFLPSLTLHPLLPLPCLPLPPFPLPSYIPLPLEVGPLKSS